MNKTDHSATVTRLMAAATLIALLAILIFLSGCGGGGGADPAAGSGAAGNATSATPVIVSESGSQSARVGEAVTFSVTAVDAQGYQWQANPGPAWADVPGATQSRHTVTNLTLAQNGTRYRVFVNGTAGSVVSSEFGVTVGESLAAPTITTQPADQATTVGGSVTMSVVANAASATYAWQLSVDGGSTWSTIGGATSDTLALPNLALADNGKRYRVLISNAAGVVTSGSALLTVTESVVKPTIATQPADQSVNPGQNAVFNVSAVGTSLAYQWHSSADGVAFAPVAGATTATLTRTGTTLADNGSKFRVVVSNSADSVTSSVATLNVATAVIEPTITTQPTGQTAGEGQNTSMSVTATGSTLAYRWQASTDDGANWGDVAGGSAATLALNNVAMTDNGKLYRVIVSNSAKSVTSSTARLTVTAAVQPPVVTKDPVGASRMVGQGASVTVEATGPMLSIAWESSPNGMDPWTSVAGATNATLALSNLAITDNGRRYRARISNPARTVTSGAAVMTVVWGSVTTSDDVTNLDVVYGGGDSGDSPGGGGDGAGADGGGGLGKTLNAEFTVTRLADGAAVGKAFTHEKTGLVKIKAGPGATPLLLTLRGTARASYYDEGKAALGEPPMVAFGADKVLHALVDTIDENLGVTPLTEAVYRYAINHFIVDPVKVADGSVPIRSTASDAELSKLTKAQIQTAHKVVLDELNRKLPKAYRLVSLKALPTPVDGNSSTDALTDSRYGLAQVVSGGLVAAVGQFNPSVVDPAFTSVEQFARDLTDGKIDGLALDGRPMAPDKTLPAYDSARFPNAINVGADLQANRFGRTKIYASAPEFAEVAEYHHITSSNADTTTCDISYVALRKGGLVSRNVSQKQTAIGARCPLDGPVTGQNSDWGGQARQLQPDTFIVSNSGTVQGIGSANCGRLGAQAKTDYENPVPVVGLKDVTAILSGGVNTAARDKTGQVFTVGKNVAGSLGIGGDKYDTTCEDVPTNLNPRALPTLSNIVSLFKGGELTYFALAADGNLFGWGSGGQGQFPVLEGRANPADRPAPEQVVGIKATRAVAATANTVHALRADGTVWGWGLNTNGEFGDGTTTTKPVAQQVPGLKDITQIESNQNHYVYALDGAGKVWRWGNCPAAECSKPTPQVPTVVPDLPVIRQLSPGVNRVFAITEDGLILGLQPATMKAANLTEQFR